LTSAKTIKVERETLATTAPGVYAGGDVAFGPRNLIDAVANGKLAARSMHGFLSGESRSPRFFFRFDKVPTRQFSRTDGYERLGRESPPTSDLGRRTGISEVEVAYDEPEARIQAERCLSCHIQTIYDPQKCVLCNRCVDICPEDCLKLVPVEELDLSPDEIDAAREIAGVETDQVASAMIKDDEVCIRCGLCAIRCPTDAMTMEVLYYEQQRGE
jgi:NAD-dependent dihydropyrimidine dehydrogenase PreA subunit